MCFTYWYLVLKPIFYKPIVTQWVMWYISCTRFHFPRLFYGIPQLVWELFSSALIWNWSPRIVRNWKCSADHVDHTFWLPLPFLASFSPTEGKFLYSSSSVDVLHTFPLRFSCGYDEWSCHSCFTIWLFNPKFCLIFSPPTHSQHFSSALH